MTSSDPQSVTIPSDSEVIQHNLAYMSMVGAYDFLNMHRAFQEGEKAMR